MGNGDAEGAGDTMVPGLPGAEPRDAPSIPGDFWWIQGKLERSPLVLLHPQPWGSSVPSSPRLFHSLKLVFTKSKCFTVG